MRRDDCIKKANIIIPRLNSGVDALKLLKCIVTIGDKTLGTSFLTTYFSKHSVTVALSDELLPFVNKFGVDAMKPALLHSINTSRFSANPTEMANFVVKFCGALDQKAKDAEDDCNEAESGAASSDADVEDASSAAATSSSSNEIVTDSGDANHCNGEGAAAISSNDGSASELSKALIEAFVSAMFPADVSSRRAPSGNAESFPLNSILGLLDNHGNSSASAIRVTKGYVWLSSQQTSLSTGYRYSYHRSTSPKGPKQLLTAMPYLNKLFEKEGWNVECEAVLVEASEKLCQYASFDEALVLVERLSPNASSISKRMASTACEKALSSSYSLSTVDACKKLITAIGKFCPSLATRFTEYAKKLNATAVLLPLVTDLSFAASVHDCLKEAMTSLTIFCLEKSTTADQVKSLARAVSTCCHTVASAEFTNAAKKLDVCSLIYPLVTDNALRAAANVGMKESLASLTYYAAQCLRAKASDNA